MSRTGTTDAGYVQVSLKKLSNTYDVWLPHPSGVAHASSETPGYTLCDTPIRGGRWIHLIQVVVWLKSSFCPQCFTMNG